MCIFDWYMYQPFQPDPIFTSLISGLLGALVGGIFSCLVTELAHIHNRKLKDDELKLYEKATALSIIEELKVLRDEYQEEFDKQYEELNPMQYLPVVYEISQDYSTVYNQNAREIGLIKNATLRNLIIKSNILLKKYIEDLKIYKQLFGKHYELNKNFVATAYPKLIDKDCSEIDYESIIYNYLISKIENKDPSWHDNPNLSEAQITSFYYSYNNSKNHLCYFSQRLKNDYYRLKEVIKNVIQKSKELYGE